MITVNTDFFFRSHFRSPRGCGSWGFMINGVIHWFNGKYGEAKKSAVAKAREVGAKTVTVMP